MVPVNVDEGKAPRDPIYRLLGRKAEGQEVIDDLVGALYAIVFHVLETLDGRLDVLFAEPKFLAMVPDAI
jgi:hypothetical protein